MSGTATKRCTICHQVAVISDRGKIRRVGNVRYVETRPNGDAVFECPCIPGGVLVTWEREPERVVK